MRRYIYNRVSSHMKRKLLLLSSIVLLSACKSTPYVIKASQSDINKYFEKQEIKPQGGNVEHSKYGKMAATQEPYKSTYIECLNQSFSSVSFMFGQLNVSDPQKLKQYSNDHLMHQLGFLISKNGRRDATIRPIFDDPSFKPTLEKIHSLTSNTLTCVKSKGWVYLTNKRNKSEK